MSFFSKFVGTSAIKAGIPRPAKPTSPDYRPTAYRHALPARSKPNLSPGSSPEPPPATPAPEDSGIKENKPSEMQLLLRQAREDLGERHHPEEMAAYLQAAATLRLAGELAQLRQLFESGAGGFTVGVENG